MLKQVVLVLVLVENALILVIAAIQVQFCPYFKVGCRLQNESVDTAAPQTPSVFLESYIWGRAVGGQWAGCSWPQPITTYCVEPVFKLLVQLKLYMFIRYQTGWSRPLFNVVLKPFCQLAKLVYRLSADDVIQYDKIS